MKIYLFIFVFSLVCFSCGNNKNQIKSTVVLKLAKAIDSKKSKSKEIGLKLNKKEIKDIRKRISLASLKNDETLEQVIFRVDNPNEPDVKCYYDTIFCGTDTIVKQVCVDYPGTIAHSVTGEIEVGRFTVKSGQRIDNQCEFRDDCIEVSSGVALSIGVSLNIKVPCTEVNSSEVLDFKMMLFGGLDNTINNFVVHYFHPFQNKGSNTTYVNDYFPVDIAENSYQCGDGCYVKMFINFDFIPEFIQEPCRPKPYTLAFQLEDSSIIEHSDSASHDSNSHSASTVQHLRISSILEGVELVEMKKKLASQNIDDAVIVNSQLVRAVCSQDPTTLADFQNANNSIECDHLADHTLVLELPLCSKSPFDKISQEVYLYGAKNLSNN